jgi:tetratricopeptide (TPR) repeat protein
MAAEPRPAYRSILAICLAALLTALPPATAAAPADASADIQQLLEQGKLAEAATAVETQLAADPASPSYRFLKGLVLTRQNQLDKAEKVFTELTVDHPELPEPYNNLAVIYAARGHYDKARELLQKAINTHPSYATAHENLGDIYAKMASEAYNQALELNQENAAAKAKLSLIDGLFVAPQTAPLVVAAAAPARAPAQTGPAPTAAPVTDKVEPPAAAKSATTSAAGVEPPATAKSEPPVAMPKPQRPETGVAATPAPEPAPPPVPPPADPAEVENALRGWAAAWSARDVAGYLAHYADDFTPPNGLSRRDWEQARAQRIGAPSFIKVELADLQVTPHGSDHATAQFMQHYQSDQFSDSVLKSVLLKRAGTAWLITQESVQVAR